MQVNRSEFANNLRAYRELFQMSQCEVAKALGIPTGNYQHWEAGRACPNLESLAKLKEVFGLKAIDQLIDRRYMRDQAEDPPSILYRRYMNLSPELRKLVDVALSMKPEAEVLPQNPTSC